MEQGWLRAKDLFWAAYLGPGRWTTHLAPAWLLRQGGRWLSPIGLALSGPARRRFPQELVRYPALKNVPGGVERLFRAHVANAFQRSLDDLLMERYPIDDVLLNSEVKGQEHLEAARALGKGVLLCSGHFFANRLGKRFLRARGWPIMSVRNTSFRDPNIGKLAGQFLQERYYRFLNRVIEDEITTDDPECALKILARLRTGGIVDIHFDPPTPAKDHIFDFLGARMPFPIGFLDVARTAQCPIVPMLCLGNSRGLTIEFSPPVQPRSAPREEVLGLAVRAIEGQVLAHPEEWEHTVRL